jgi:hypothetical protein
MNDSYHPGNPIGKIRAIHDKKMATVKTVALLIEWTVYMRKILCSPDNTQ